MKSRQIPIAFSNGMVEAVRSSSDKPLALFVREAVAEKLSRDFGILLNGDEIKLARGERTDLINADSATHAKMRSQAAHARESRWKK